MALHILEEAQRCLNCKVPLCQRGCPIQTPIPTVIRQLLDGKIDEAGHTLYENNPLTAICPLVCNHRKQCEGHCILARKGAPVHFSSIERYVSSLYTSRMEPSPTPDNGIRVAIIGSGPAGLTIAVILARKGYRVTIFEGRDRLGGVLRYGIPDFRLPKELLDEFEYRHLVQQGIRVRPNTRVGGAVSIENLFFDDYKAIFLGTGVWQPKTLNIKGETLGNVHYGINYLNNPDSYYLGHTLNVIGAGNAAMDVCRTALRKGVRRVRCFSLSRKIAADRLEFDYATTEGVEFLYNKRPLEIVEEGVYFEDVAEYEDGTYDSIPHSRQLYEADSTIISISQGARSQLVKTTHGLKADAQGLLIADEYGRTSRPGVFACGDMTAGSRTVVEAVAQSKMIAEAMDAYMQGRKIDKRIATKVYV